MNADMIPQSGTKQSGESTGLPAQNTRANLNGKSSGSKQSSSGGSMAEKGYNRESM